MSITHPFEQAEAVVEIPLERITESVNNPRKTYSDETLQEMADSIASQGVLQPIVVRELANSIFGHEIVFGHRRFRGSVKAGRDTIPAIVRQMTDEQADQARLHENLEREDVHYIERAEAMQRLMQQHGVTAADLVAQTGKKLTYVYGHLKLANLHQKVREACLASTFTAEVATLIGRWPLAVQPAAMAACLEHADIFDAAKGKVSRSYRDCKRQLRNLAIPISRASFDPADATLLRGDGYPGACNGCPNNTDSDAELAEHFEAAQCLLNSCFEVKVAVHQGREVDVARAEGRVAPIADGRSADELSLQQWMGHTVGGTVAGILTDAESAGLALPAPKLLVDDKGVVVQRVYSREAVRALQAQLYPEAVASPTAPGADDDEDSDGWLDKLDPDQRAVADGESWEKVRGAVLAAARRTPRTADDLREVMLNVLDLCDRFHDAAEQAMGWPDDLDDLDDPLEARQSMLRSMGADDLAAMIVLDAICERTNSNLAGYFPPEHLQRKIGLRLELAHRYGVDVLNATEPTPPPAPPSSELRTPENAAPAAAKGRGGKVRYRNPSTGDTWSGKGLQPNWLKAALAAGRSLADFDTAAGQSSQTTPAGACGSTAEAAA